VLPESTANIAFADAGQTACITASTSVFRIQVATPGKMPLHVKDGSSP
jgi:hypothetical protein